MGTIKEIEKLTKDYSEARQKLASIVCSYEREIEEVKKLHLPGIRRAAENASAKKTRLQLAISDSKERFVKPKTVIFYGIKIGFQKGKGELQWDDPDQVVRLIKKNFPEQAEILVKTKEEPSKNALAKLSVGDLKKLGVTVIETGEQIIVKPTNSDIDQLVNALLSDEDIQSTKEAA